MTNQLIGDDNDMIYILCRKIYQYDYDNTTLSTFSYGYVIMIKVHVYLCEPFDVLMILMKVIMRDYVNLSWKG